MAPRNESQSQEVLTKITKNDNAKIFSSIQIKEKHDEIGFFDLEVQTQIILEACEVD